MKKVLNYINGEWLESTGTQFVDVVNPTTNEVLARTPLSPPCEVDDAARAAAIAWPEWRRTPLEDRIQHLFKLRTFLEDCFDELSCIITLENGKILAESQGELRRAIENVEVACGIPTMMQGDVLEDAARGIDELMIRQPVGVCATIAPFNFPGMIPFWFLPYALACGNTYIIKLSERVPLTMQRIFELIEQAGFPKGVVNLVNGSAETVNAILDHPTIRAIPPASRTASGKRGGAKNPIVILPDAELATTTHIVADSAFGCAGQRCLAASLVFTVGEARNTFTEAITEAASTRVTGFGLDQGVQMGPVISQVSRQRILSLIDRGVQEGAKVLVDGRGKTVTGYERGSFVHPTILSDINVHGELIRTEIFGPVLDMIHLKTTDEAIELVNSGQYGNMASLFTTSGTAARKFRYEAGAGNMSINIGAVAL